MLQEIVNTLPPQALLVFVVVFGLVVGTKYAGKFLGTITSPEPAQPTAQVAAMIVDSTVLRACTEKVCDSLDGLANEIRHSRDELREVRSEIRRATDESMRRNR